jgi:hypothetical protein
MPLVELIAADETAGEATEAVETTLTQLGKRPIRCRDVPGFAWNRLQIAILREAVWLVGQGVVSTAALEEILSDGLARRWRNIGFFDAIALGGVDTWERAAGNLLPELSSAMTVGDLASWLSSDPQGLAAVAEKRDRGLARDLLGGRAPTLGDAPPLGPGASERAVQLSHSPTTNRSGQ